VCRHAMEVDEPSWCITTLDGPWPSFLVDHLAGGQHRHPVVTGMLTLQVVEKEYGRVVVRKADSQRRETVPIRQRRL